MRLTDESKQAMIDCGIPRYMHRAIIDFYENGWQPGGFLTAVINNDLKESVGRADDTNINCLKNYVMWFYNHAPGGSWGFENAVETWCNRIEEEKLAQVEVS
jgi:hypothetical protein